MPAKSKEGVECVQAEQSCLPVESESLCRGKSFLKMLLECSQDVKKVLDLEPNNREARALAKEVAKAQKEEDQKSKGLFGKMCQALGTGPIREPYVDRRFDFDAEERLQKEAET